MSEGVIEARGLTRIFTVGGEDIRAVDGVDLVIGRGEFVSIMGPSGSGKTTLLNLLGCLDRPTSGTVLFQGQDVSQLSERQRDSLRLRRLGFIFQTFNLLPTLTALENVMLPLEIAGVSSDERVKRAEELLSWVGLLRRAHHRPGELSSGENQRVAIARALANQPLVLLADEPTGNLDSKTTREIVILLQRVNIEYGTAVILVTHDPEVARAGTRLVRMSDGRIMAKV